MTVKPTTKTKNLIKTTLAATLTPPATHRLDAAKVTRELLEHHPNQKRRSTLIRDTVQTVSKLSLALIATFHGLLSTSRFLFQPLLPSTNSANTTVPVETRLLLSILTVLKRGGLGQISWSKPLSVGSINDCQTENRPSYLTGSSIFRSLTGRSTI